MEGRSISIDDINRHVQLISIMEKRLTEIKLWIKRYSQV